jgi:hypothetical protein
MKLKVGQIWSHHASGLKLTIVSLESDFSDNHVTITESYDSRNRKYPISKQILTGVYVLYRDVVSSSKIWKDLNET